MAKKILVGGLGRLTKKKYAIYRADAKWHADYERTRKSSALDSMRNEGNR